MSLTLAILLTIIFTQQAYCQIKYTSILGEINVPLDLICDSGNADYLWYKSPRILLSDPNDAKVSIDTKYFAITGNKLTLNLPNRTDMGRLMYFTYNTLRREAYCYFDIYLYQTFSPGKFIFVVDKANANVKNEYDLQNIPYNKPPPEIRLNVVFPYQLDFYYRLETLPMDALIMTVDNRDMRLFTRNCTREDSQTFCLESNDTLTFYKCQPSAEIKLSFDYNYPKTLFNGQAPYAYVMKFIFEYPPQVIYPTVNYYVNSKVETITLDCKTYDECKKPTSYLWLGNDGNPLGYSKEGNSTFTYTTNFITNDDVHTVTCDVQAGLSGLSSRTTFKIRVKKGLEPWGIAIVIIAVIAFIILFCICLFFTCKRCRSKTTKGSYSTEAEKTNKAYVKESYKQQAPLPPPPPLPPAREPRGSITSEDERF